MPDESQTVEHVPKPAKEENGKADNVMASSKTANLSQGDCRGKLTCHSCTSRNSHKVHSSSLDAFVKSKMSFQEIT